ncbi:MAG TPA: M20/M25/M40 family metallo-hydrolase [bacterium]|nr:M20/M25/M40 family metallo-hydrolase [bacterium]
MKLVQAAWLMSLCLALSGRAKDPEAITIAELQEHVTYLASDAMKGRKPGTEEARQAAEYIKKELKKCKLELLGGNGLQEFYVVTGVEPGIENQFSFRGSEGRLMEDFTPLSFSASAHARAPLAFAGYGFHIETDSLTWRDYDALDVSGRWVMILREAPDGGAPNSGFEPYTPLRKKVAVAKDRGAVGVLFVSGEKTDQRDALLPLVYDDSPGTAGLPVLHIKRSLADQLLAEAGQTIAGLEAEFYRNKSPHSFLLGDTLRASAEVILQQTRTANVAAQLTGNDPLLKNEFLVIGAHYDHLGLGGPGSHSRRPDTVAVHNGADDNASGVAGMLELAEALAANRKSLRRSVLFVAFSAEEMGTLGSRYFVDHPPAPLSQIKYMLNLDMVGRMHEEEKVFSVGGVGTAQGMEEILNRLAQGRAFTIKMSPEGAGPSDHASFYAKDIPVLFFMADLHEDYHTPDDDSDKLNYAGQKMIVDYILDAAKELANRPESLAFQEAGPKTPPRGRRFKITLGVMPDHSAAGIKGLRVSVVDPDRPAGRGGMIKGDVIVAIDGKPVNDIYEYMHRLSELRSGDRISVEVMRNGQKKILIVDL